MRKAVRNAAAKDLASPKYRLRIVRAAKGKGSYRRNERRMSGKLGGASFRFWGGQHEIIPFMRRIESLK